ncbi:MAG: ferrous iron transport protein A [Clostridia bacterium]|nr:ferrous iron transport protein A [Clostridia bacterium]MBR3296175.1 ferrous iron transport protein A [Clostridia bacterium]
MLPLAFCNEGEDLVIKKINGKDDVTRHLENLGFVVGGNVSIVSKMGDNVIVSVKESRIAISREMAQKVMV